MGCAARPQLLLGSSLSPRTHKSKQGIYFDFLRSEHVRYLFFMNLNDCWKRGEKIDDCLWEIDTNTGRKTKIQI